MWDYCCIGNVHCQEFLCYSLYTCIVLFTVHCAGVRLYFTTTPDGQQGRPVLLAMVHARLPPGFSPSSTMLKPGNTIHLAYYRRGNVCVRVCVCVCARVCVVCVYT